MAVFGERILIAWDLLGCFSTFFVFRHRGGFRDRHLGRWDHERATLLLRIDLERVSVESKYAGVLPGMAALPTSPE